MVHTFDPLDLDRLFLFISACLIVFMQAGFAMLEAGCVTINNVDLILFKNLLDFCVSGVLYWAVGYAFAFGGDFDEVCKSCNSFIGTTDFFLIHLTETNFFFYFFEFAACAASATILSGAIAGRMKWQGYIIVSGMISGFIYPVASHWLWSNKGWLSLFAPPSAALFGRGAMDFAGAGCVHMVGGLTSLVACKMLGQRNEFLVGEDLSDAKLKKMYVPRYQNVDGNWQTNELKSYNTSLATLGVFILWFGWYGFNCGGALKFNAIEGQAVGRVAVNTTLAGGAAGIITIFIGRIQSRDSPYYKYNLVDLTNGALAGLVSITGACAFVQPWAALCIGSIAAFVYKGACALMGHPKIRVDDPLDAIALHGCCGSWGVIASGFFAYPGYLNELAVTTGRGGGVFYGYGTNLGIQIIEFLVMFAWTITWGIIMFSIILLIDKNRGSHAFFTIRGVQYDGLGFGHHEFSPKTNLQDPTSFYHYYYDEEVSPKKGGLIHNESNDNELREINN